MRIIANNEDLIALTKQHNDWAARVAFAYVRVSSLEQGTEGYSLEAQEKLLIKYGDALMIPMMYIFKEQATAKSSGRKEFDRMLKFYRQHCDEKNCPFLFVEKADRLSRNQKDEVAIQDIVDDIDLAVHYVKENHIQTSDSKAAENFMLAIRMSVAKFYSENLAEEAAKGMKAKAESGMYPSCAPIGYMNIIGTKGKKILIPDPVRAPIVKRIFKWYAYDGKGILEIHNLAKKAGLTSARRKNLISRNTIDNILHRSLYAGFFEWKGVQYQGTYEPLISVELFNKVQALLKSKAPYSAGSPPTTKIYTFTKILECGVCGCLMVGELKKKKYTYYHCTGNRDPNCPNKRRGGYAKGWDVENQALDLLNAIQIDESILPEIIEALRQANANERIHCEDAIRSLKQRLNTCTERLDMLLDMYLDKKIKEAMYDDRYDRIITEQKEAERCIEAFQALNPEKLENGVRLLELVQGCVITYEKQTPIEKRKILKIICSNLVWRDGRLIVEYRKPFDILTEFATPHIHKKAASIDGNGLRSLWLPKLGLNYSSK